MSANQIMPEQSITTAPPAPEFNEEFLGAAGETVREQDRLLPIANVARIMKMAIPTNAKIAKDAKETVQECVSELISFVTSEYMTQKIRPLQSLKQYLEPVIGASRKSAKPSTEKTLSGRSRPSALTSTAT